MSNDTETIPDPDYEWSTWRVLAEVVAVCTPSTLEEVINHVEGLDVVVFRVQTGETSREIIIFGIRIKSSK